MEAKVKSDSRYRTIIAFSGMEFIKGEWRAVPVGCEAEAMRNEYLETQEKPVEVPAEKVEEVVEVAPVVIETKAEKAAQAAPKKARGKQ
jgi:hypothetical protein